MPYPELGGDCTLTGYPGVDTAGATPLLHAVRTPRGYMGGLPSGDDTPPVVTLAHHKSANAVVEAATVNASGASCPVYPKLTVTPPNTSTSRTVSAVLAACILYVHPVIASS